MVYGQKQLKIVSYKISDASPEVNVASFNTTNLLITFDRGNRGIGAQNIVRKIPLKVEVDGSNKIITCVAMSAANDKIWSYAANNVDIYYPGFVGVGAIDPGANEPKAQLHVKGGSVLVTDGSIISAAQPSSIQCIDFSKGNIQVSSYNSTGNTLLGGLMDGGVYSVVLTGYPSGTAVTFRGFTDETCTTPVTYGVDFGGSTTASTPTFSTDGNTQVVTFIYSAARAIVYGSASTNFFR